MKSLSRVWLFATPWTGACQAPPSMGFFQSRILEWVAVSFSRGSFRPKDRTWVSRTAGELFTAWATREAQVLHKCHSLHDSTHLPSSVQSLSRINSLRPHGLQPGFPVHYQLLELTQTHVHWVGNAIQPSYPLSSPYPLSLNLSQHQGLFQWVSSLHQVAKVLAFQRFLFN